MKIKNIIGVCSLAVTLLLSSCTSGFDDLNIDPDGHLSEGFSDPHNYISATILYSGNLNYIQENNALAGGAHLQERIKLLQLDGFAQYHTGSYGPTTSWARDYWGAQYVTYIKTLNAAIETSDIFPEKGNLVAYALVWRTHLQANLTDYFGPAPYPLESTDEAPLYQSVEEQYTQFFADLDEAMKLFDEGQAKLSQETIYNGDVVKWKRFANSLRLRLAVKLTEIDEAWAKEEIAKAINGSGGLLQQGDDATAKSYELWGNTYMYSVFSWVKIKMTTTMEKMLTNIGGVEMEVPSFDVEDMPEKADPRALEMYQFSDAYGSPAKRSWRGINGSMINAGGYAATVSNMNQSNYVNASLVASRPQEHLTYLEVCFLLAEVYERGFASGDAKGWYEKGVKESFRKFKIEESETKATDYLASTDKNLWGTSASYDDVGGAGNTALEKIVTQRYIGYYPDMSLQVWNDKRRLNLPAMDILESRPAGEATWPADKNIQNPKNYVQRMPFPSSEQGLNTVRYEEGKGILVNEAGANDDGGDRVLTPIWWASKMKNYCTSVTN